jgi:hypothetical protein
MRFICRSLPQTPGSNEPPATPRFAPLLLAIYRVNKTSSPLPYALNTALKKFFVEMMISLLIIAMKTFSMTVYTATRMTGFSRLYYLSRRARKTI